MLELWNGRVLRANYMHIYMTPGRSLSHIWAERFRQATYADMCGTNVKGLKFSHLVEGLGFSAVRFIVRLKANMRLPPHKFKKQRECRETRRRLICQSTGNQFGKCLQKQEINKKGDKFPRNPFLDNAKINSSTLRIIQEISWGTQLRMFAKELETFRNFKTLKFWWWVAFPSSLLTR